MSELNLYQRILKVADAVGSVEKAKTAKVRTKSGAEFTYEFRGVDAVMSALRGPCLEHGIVIIPGANSAEWKQVENTTVGIYDITFINAEDPEDRMTVPSIGYGNDNSDKGPGKALSYAWRTLMEKVFYMTTGEADNEDADDKSGVGHPHGGGGGASTPGSSSRTPPPSSSDEWDGSQIVAGGEFKGHTWAELPDEYLEWCATEASNTNILRAGKAEQVRRQLNQEPPPIKEGDDLPF